VQFAGEGDGVFVFVFRNRNALQVGLVESALHAFLVRGVVLLGAGRVYKSEQRYGRKNS
jgi:hypothetical protein